MRLIAVTILLWLGTAHAEFTIAGPFAAREGETCVVCNSKLSRDDLAYTIDGQRVAVMKGMEQEVLANPGKYVKQARPEGMLFSGEKNSGMTSPWFWAGLFVLTGLVFGGFCAHTAMGKGYSPSQWFALGFFFSVAAQLALLSKPSLRDAPAPSGLAKIPATASPILCRACGSANHPTARNCIRCGKATA